MKYFTGFKANILGKMSDGSGKSAYQVSNRLLKIWCFWQYSFT